MQNKVGKTIQKILNCPAFIFHMLYTPIQKRGKKRKIALT